MAYFFNQKQNKSNILLLERKPFILLGMEQCQRKINSNIGQWPVAFSDTVDVKEVVTIPW